MKHILLGIAGLLMLAFNVVYFFSRDDAAASAASSAVQQGDNTSTTQLDCNHDCAACGKCFPEGTTAPSASTYNLTVAAKNKLTIE